MTRRTYIERNIIYRKLF